MDDIYTEILRLEKEMHEIQVQHSLGRLGTRRAKQRIRALSEELLAAIAKLPLSQRELYELERQYGAAS